jgi:quercetin dioxygenase-like cupin family protein
MSNLVDLDSIEPIRIWEGVRGRRVESERITMAVVELDPNAIVPDHHHPHEQVGIVLRGTLRFHVGDEVRDLRPGGTWRVLADVPHGVEVGPDGAVVMDIFSPPRDDWNALPVAEPRAPSWPSGARDDL